MGWIPSGEAPTAEALASTIQAGVPLLAAPFAALAEQLGTTEEAVLGQLRAWSEQGLLREISAVLEGSALGHDSALVAGAVAPGRLEEVAAVVGEHPMVSHNYAREHDYNLWFTIATPPSMDLDRTLALLAHEAGVDSFHPLRRTHTFKIGVNFSLSGRRNQTERHDVTPVATFSPDASERAMLRALQTPLALEPRPFDRLATAAGVRTPALLAFAEHHRGGAIRRYTGVFRHRKLGVRGNGMAVWDVGEDRMAAIGHAVAAEPCVSHCYARDPAPGFPFRFYAMIHGPDRETASALAQDIGRRHELGDGLVLFSTRQFKKCRLRYFQPELDEWWAARCGERP